MTVGTLKKLLEGVDDEIKVFIPATMEFDGMFYTPCQVDSGPSKMATDPDLEEEDIKELELLGKEPAEIDVFLLLPCGFGDEKDHKHELN